MGDGKGCVPRGRIRKSPGQVTGGDPLSRQRAGGGSGVRLAAPDR